MRYLLAIVLPPVAVLACGKPFSALLNCVLTLLVWLPGMIHAICVVAGYEADIRAYRQRQAIRESAMAAARYQAAAMAKASSASP